MTLALKVPTVSVQLGWDYQNPLAWNTIHDAVTFSHRGPSGGLKNGTGAGNANKIFVDLTTINPSATKSYDLNGGVVDAFQNVVSFTRVKVLFFELLPDTAASAVALGGSGTNPFVDWLAGVTTGKLRVRNGGCLFLGCYDGTGYTTANGAADVLLVTNEDAVSAATYRIAVIGE